jgi:hypothetical protein
MRLVSKPIDFMTSSVLVICLHVQLYEGLNQDIVVDATTTTINMIFIENVDET